jgi:hypothetical protein
MKEEQFGKEAQFGNRRDSGNRQSIFGKRKAYHWSGGYRQAKRAYELSAVTVRASAAKPKRDACYGTGCQEADVLTGDDPGNVCLHQHLFKPAPI